MVDGTVYVVTTLGDVYALDAKTGATEWRHRSGGTRVPGTPAVVDGTVYVASGPVYALDAADGTERWNFLQGNELVDVEATPTVVDGVVYVEATAPEHRGRRDRATHSGDGRVVALDASSGTTLWEVSTEYPVRSSLATDGETLYVATVSPTHGPKGKIHALRRADGASRWRIELKDVVDAGQVVTDTESCSASALGDVAV